MNRLKRINILLSCLLLLTLFLIVACSSEPNVLPTESAEDPSAPTLELPFQLPKENLLLLCNNTDTISQSVPNNLYHLDLKTHAWTTELNGRVFQQIFPVPDRQSVLLQEELSGSEGADQIVRWRGAEAQTLFNNSAYTSEGKRTEGQFDPTGRWLVVYQQRPFRAARPALLDLASCDQGECSTTPLDGMPFWSPDGQRTLLNDTTYTPEVETSQGLLLGNARGEVITQISETPVVSPFWLDAETYGYLRPQLEIEPPADTTIVSPTELVVATIATHEPTVVLKTEDLWPLQPDEKFPLSFYSSVSAVPDDSDQLLILAIAYDPEAVEPSGPGLTAASQQSQLWLLERSTDQLFLLHQGASLFLPGFSPDGRWLLVWEFLFEEQSNATTPPNAQASLHLFDHHNEWQRLTFDAFPDPPWSRHSGSWSADGQRLFIAGDEQLHIITPDENQHVSLPLPVKGCNQLVWRSQNDS